MKKCIISKITGRQILDSRGNPTVEARVLLEDGSVGVGIVPSGASTGAYEAVELRDSNKEYYNGKGVLNAVANINTRINDLLIGMDANDIAFIDNLMIKEDGSENKSKLGANAILAVSIACVYAVSESCKTPVYEIINHLYQSMQKKTDIEDERLSYEDKIWREYGPYSIPVPMMNILNGGRHAFNRLDFQEFMIVPIADTSYKERLRICVTIYHTLKDLLMKEGKQTAVGDEGGFAPDLKNACDALDYMVRATEKAGFKLGEDVAFAIDAAASELYDENSKLYIFDGENEKRNSQDMIEYYNMLCNVYPICSIEDGLDENDWDGWRMLTEKLGDRCMLVGDDLFVTNVKRLHKGIGMKCGNAILIKVNQIGSVSEALKAIIMAKNAGYKCIISHRSGETEDTFIADLAVALDCGFIKAGAPCRSERVAKYNRLLRIEEELGL